MGDWEPLDGIVEAMVVMRIGSIVLIGGLLLGAWATAPAGPSVMALHRPDSPFGGGAGPEPDKAGADTRLR